MSKFTNKIIRLLASDYFFYFTLAFFILQAAWTALSFRYPLPFDEYYHYGLIQIYSHHINPIISSQPPSADLYGDIVHYPSYLYHYLMSFPYRIIEHFIHTATAQIIALRFINIFIFSAGIYMFRKTFLKAGISKAGINTTILFFTLLPNATFLAAHINYDSLLILGAAFSIYLCQGIVINKKTLNIKVLGLLVATNLLVSLVQYSFLPIFLAEVIYVGWILYSRGKAYRNSMWLSIKKTSRKTGLLLSALLLVSSFLFLQRIGQNIIRYKAPAPACQQVLPVSRCEHNPTFSNAQKSKQTHTQKVSTDPMLYESKWLIDMESGYFTTGANTATGHIGTAHPSQVLRYGFAALLIVGIVMSIYYWRDIKRNSAFKLYLTIIILYGTALWLQNYRSYIDAKSLIAVNARYMFPIILLMLIIIQVAFSMAMKKRQGLKVALVVIIAAIFTQGGGIITSVVYAEPSWYWQRQKVINTNLRIRNIVNHFEINKPKPE